MSAQVKMLELRDDGTLIPLLCVDMNPHDLHGPGTVAVGRKEAQRRLLRRCGYTCDGEPNILVTRLDAGGAGGTRATNDPYAWPAGTRTMPNAHRWIIDNWATLKDGDVVDVEFILGETDAPKPTALSVSRD